MGLKVAKLEAGREVLKLLLEVETPGNESVLRQKLDSMQEPGSRCGTPQEGGYTTDNRVVAGELNQSIDRPLGADALQAGASTAIEATSGGDDDVTTFRAPEDESPSQPGSRRETPQERGSATDVYDSDEAMVVDFLNDELLEPNNGDASLDAASLDDARG